MEFGFASPSTAAAALPLWTYFCILEVYLTFLSCEIFSLIDFFGGGGRGQGRDLTSGQTDISSDRLSSKNIILDSIVFSNSGFFRIVLYMHISLFQFSWVQNVGISFQYAFLNTYNEFELSVSFHINHNKNKDQFQ